MSIDKNTQQTIYYHMDRIVELFKNAKITVYIHNPDLADGDVLSSSESSYTEMHKRMGKFIEDKIKGEGE